MTTLYTNINTNTNINYIKDPSFNFYEELNNCLNENETMSDNENVCLISNLPLDNTHITLPCDHKFNYYYIFNEIFNCKKKYSTFSNYSALGANEIRCPYCRTIYDKLLPQALDINGVYKCDNINGRTNNSFKLTCKDEKCNPTNKVYVTPLGYYCKRHYIYWKSKNNDNANENETIKKQSEQLNEHWNQSDWTKYTVSVLKRILNENNLKVSGTKPYLISRLINNNIAIPPVI